MNRYCSRLYRSFFLDIKYGLTVSEKKDFLFFCRDDLPEEILDRCEREQDFLKALVALQQRHILMFGNTDFLKQFLETIGRHDLLSKVESFDVSRELIWLFEALITSRTGEKLCKDQFDIENGCEGRTVIDMFVKHQEVFILPMDSARIGGGKTIDTQLVNFRGKVVQRSKAKRMTWELVPLLIRFAVERAVLCYNIDRVAEWEKSVVDICNQLVKEIMPWITKNGGYKEFEAVISKECKGVEPVESGEKVEDYRITLGDAAKDLHQFCLGYMLRFQDWLIRVILAN